MILTPKEKAKSLLKKFTKFYTYGVYSEVNINVAKKFTLIAVDEILNTIEQIFETFEERKYWQEVKQEIESERI